MIKHVLNKNVSNDHVGKPRKRKSTGGWPRELTGNDLRKSDRVEELYRFAIKRGWIACSDDQRFRFYRLAVYCWTANEPGRAFTTLHKEGKWFGNDDDGDEARKMIREVDRSAGKAPPAELLPQFAAADLGRVDPEQNRRDQLEALRARMESVGSGRRDRGPNSEPVGVDGPAPPAWNS